MKVVKICNDGTVYKKMSDEEIAKLKQEAENTPEPEPTQEERIAALEEALLFMMGGDFCV